MDENILRFRVGIFVVIAMCILGILIFVFSEGWERQYTVYIKPEKAPGVKVGTPIRKYGILIGRVKKVTPDDGFVTLEMGINQKEKIYANETVSIGSESILGDAGIEIMPLGKDEERGIVVPDGFPMSKVAIRADPFKMIVNMQPQVDRTLRAMAQAGVSVEEASTKIGNFSDTLQNLVQDEQGELKGLLVDFREMTVQARGAIDKFDRMFENINEVVGNPEVKGQIMQAVSEIPKVFQKINETLTKTSETVEKYGTLPDDVKPSIENIEAITAQLREQAPEVLSQVNSSLSDAEELIAQVKEFTDKINEIELENGSLYKILNEPDVHNAILETARNIEITSAKLVPLMNDLRMFGDAIARNPGAIVKGALRRNGDTNYKGSAGRDGGLLR